MGDLDWTFLECLAELSIAHYQFHFGGSREEALKSQFTKDLFNAMKPEGWIKFTVRSQDGSFDDDVRREFL